MELLGVLVILWENLIKKIKSMRLPDISEDGYFFGAVIFGIIIPIGSLLIGSWTAYPIYFFFAVWVLMYMFSTSWTAILKSFAMAFVGMLVGCLLLLAFFGIVPDTKEKLGTVSHSVDKVLTEDGNTYIMVDLGDGINRVIFDDDSIDCIKSDELTIWKVYEAKKWANMYTYEITCEKENKKPYIHKLKKD